MNRPSPVYRYAGDPESFWAAMSVCGGRPLAPDLLPEPMLACSGLPNGLCAWGIGRATWLAMSWHDVVDALCLRRGYLTLELTTYEGNS